MTAIRKQLSFYVAAAMLAALGQTAQAQDKTFTLAAPETLVSSGLLKYILSLIHI